jgi:hypothetical protein
LPNSWDSPQSDLPSRCLCSKSRNIGTKDTSAIRGIVGFVPPPSICSRNLGDSFGGNDRLWPMLLKKSPAGSVWLVI